MKQQIEHIDLNHAVAELAAFVDRFNEMADLVNEMNHKIGDMSERIYKLEIFKKEKEGIRFYDKLVFEDGKN